MLVCCRRWHVCASFFNCVDNAYRHFEKRIIQSHIKVHAQNLLKVAIAETIKLLKRRKKQVDIKKMPGYEWLTRQTLSLWRKAGSWLHRLAESFTALSRQLLSSVWMGRRSNLHEAAGRLNMNTPHIVRKLLECGAARIIYKNGQTESKQRISYLMKLQDCQWSFSTWTRVCEALCMSKEPPAVKSFQLPLWNAANEAQHKSFYGA